jgi:hypothetical protein
MPFLFGRCKYRHFFIEIIHIGLEDVGLDEISITMDDVSKGE